MLALYRSSSNQSIINIPYYGSLNAAAEELEGLLLYPVILIYIWAAGAFLSNHDRRQTGIIGETRLE
jgi:hypothetical protein